MTEERSCSACGKLFAASHYFRDGQRIVSGFCSRVCQGETHGSRRHSHTKRGRHSPEHATWTNMIQRCRPEHKDRPKYFDRGISVCERWTTFENFFADMGARPAGCSIERINNDAGYGPGNCRWASPKEQARNRRSSRIVTALGVSMTLAEWSERTGIPYGTLNSRLASGWDADRAMTTAVGISNR